MAAPSTYKQLLLAQQAIKQLQRDLYARVGDPKEWCFRTKSYGVRVFAYLDGPKEEQRDSD